MRGAADGPEHVSSLESFITLSDPTVLSSQAELLFQEAKKQTWSLDMTVKHVFRLGILGPRGLDVPDVSLSCGPSV